MEDTNIQIPDDAPPSDRSLPSNTCMRTRKGVMFASVTLTVGGAAVLSVMAIGFLASLYTTSRAADQSKPGQLMTSEDDGQSEALHIEKREEAMAQQGECLEEICLTKECVHAASDLLNYMDNTVDPCEDFYRYACGGWVKKNEYEVAGDNFVYSVAFNVLSGSIDTSLKELLRTGGNVPTEVLQTKPYEDLFLFYERCKEVDQNTPDMSAVHEVLQGLDQFQVGKPFESSSWDLTRALLQLFRINGAPLFDIVVDSDVHRVGKFAILVTSPRHFGLISSLKTNLNRRWGQGLQEFLKAGGRRALFGDVADDASVRVMLGVREGLNSHASQVVVGLDINQVSLEDVKEEERQGTDRPTQKTSTSVPQPSSTSPLTTTTTTTPHSVPHDNHTTTTTTKTTDSPTTTIPTTTSKEKENNATDEDESTEEVPVSRRIIYRIFKEDMNEKRLERLGTTLHDTFPNASVAPSSSSSSSSSDGDGPEDVYEEVMTRFLPILQELLPSEREEVEIQQKGEQYNHFTVSALQQLCPVIDWSLLLGELFNTTITDKDSIYVHYPHHLAKLCTLLDNTEPWVLHYALLTLYSYDVLQETVYAAEGIDRDDFCLQAAKGVFGEVMSNLYLYHIGNGTLENIRASTSSIMEFLMEEVEETLSAATWLREKDREEALRKIHTMGVKIGAKDSHWNITFVNKSHDELSFPSDATFLHTVLELYRAFRQELYELYNTTLDKDEFIWSFTVQPYVVNAFYAADMNTIVFPEAFFHPPYHRHLAPNYLNYGSTTTSMAHEIFHSLDFLGIQFDEQGLLTRPFSEDMTSHLNDTANCYYDLLSGAFYEEVYVPNTLIAFEIDNDITRNENLADISGIRAAFGSYLRWEAREGVEPRLPAIPLNPHQLFFVSAAQPYCSVTTRVGDILLMELDEHLPNKIRINGMMKNLPEFAKTFNCSAKSKMFSANTCHLF